MTKLLGVAFVILAVVLYFRRRALEREAAAQLLDFEEEDVATETVPPAEEAQASSLPVVEEAPPSDPTPLNVEQSWKLVELRTPESTPEKINCVDLVQNGRGRFEIEEYMEELREGQDYVRSEGVRSPVMKFLLERSLVDPEGEETSVNLSAVVQRIRAHYQGNAQDFAPKIVRIPIPKPGMPHAILPIPGARGRPVESEPVREVVPIEGFFHTDTDPGKYHGIARSYTLGEVNGELVVTMLSEDRGPEGARPGDWPVERETHEWPLAEFQRSTRNEAVLQALDAAMARHRRSKPVAEVELDDEFVRGKRGMFYRKIASSRPKHVQTFSLSGGDAEAKIIFCDDRQLASDPREWDEEMREMSVEEFNQEFADHPARAALVEFIQAQAKSE